MCTDGGSPGRVARAVGTVAVVSAVLASVAAASPTRAATVLTASYRGDDGSQLYVRQIGSQIRGFAEHPRGSYAFIFNGTINGSKIDGHWWDVPKGKRARSGQLRLAWLSSEGRLVRTGGSDFGPESFAQVTPGSPWTWPGTIESGFQAKSDSDFDGAFRGNDGSTNYVRDDGATLVWLGERFLQPGTKPVWATVFIGARTGVDRFIGSWIDIPKGAALGAGSFTADRVRVDRSIDLVQNGAANRAAVMAADWALDVDALTTTMRTALDGNVVGYAFAISEHGQPVSAVAGGSRRLPQDGGALPFTTATQNSAASSTKLVTAALVMRVLKDKGIPVTAKVLPYLPTCWKQTGVDIDELTFKNLLDHSSRLDRGLSQGACSADPYECLRRSIENGQNGSPLYENINYTLFRYFVPLVHDYPGTNAIFEQYGCGDSTNASTRAARRRSINGKVSKRFNLILRSRLLTPFGIAAGYTSTLNDWAFGYDFSNQTAPGQPPNEQALLTGGSGGMKWSASAYAKFLSTLERGQIVPLETVRQMKQQSLGFDSAATGQLTVTGVTGQYFWKAGDSGNFTSRAMIFPGRVVAFVTINSANNNVSGVGTILANAFDAALK
jgi:CubicO group peptidase (beta-lactamase class C family)